jgi:hypothetical protein
VSPEAVGILGGKFSSRGTTSVGFTAKGDFSAKVDLQITGGTGKYKGATGRAVGTGKGNVFAQSFVIDLDGQMVLRQGQAGKNAKGARGRAGR